MEMLNRISGAIAIILVALAPTSVDAKSRFDVQLDDGSTITVDNNSSYPDTWVRDLVLAADRSTQEDCPYDPPNRKGLLKSGDRIFCGNNYLAWFDYTRTDGWERSGALAGWWTLDPSTDYFRYWKTGPNACWNWAHNELIPGSASPNGESNWWDAYAFPTEHSMEIVSGVSRHFFSYPYAKHTGRSQWTAVLDGTTDGAGVHYKTSARMTSWSEPHNVDVTDDDDANGIGNYIRSEVEYICGADNIRCIWKFKPESADVVCSMISVFIWSAYAQDEDGTACDVGPGSQWPNQVFGQPLHNKCSLSLRNTFGAPNTQPVYMVMGPACQGNNRDIYSYPNFAVGNGDWIRCGETSNLSVNSPRWQFKSFGNPGSGAGTRANPEVFGWKQLVSWNEVGDGTLGFGAKTQSQNPSGFVTLRAGRWYKVEFEVSTNF